MGSKFSPSGDVVVVEVAAAAEVGAALSALGAALPPYWFPTGVCCNV
jgi:hypothetical protein